MSLYNVTLYTIVMVRVPRIEANSPQEADAKARELLVSVNRPNDQFTCHNGAVEWVQFDSEYADPDAARLNRPSLVDLLTADGDDLPDGSGYDQLLVEEPACTACGGKRMTKRFFVILDVDDGFDGDKSDVAMWVDCMLSDDHRRVETTVFNSLDDMIADRDEKVGAFKD